MDAKEIREIIEGNRLELRGQPKWTFGKNTCNTYELFPENLILEDGSLVASAPLMENIEESEELTLLFSRWFLESAMGMAEKLTQETEAHVTLSINLLPLYANQESFCAEVEALLERTGLPPERLHLELSEAQSLTRQGIENLNLLHDERGVGLLLGNFGMGHSNIDLLLEVHFDSIELDRSFAAKVPENEQTCRVVISILHLAHTLDLTVCAKGIENQEQFEFFEELDCEKGQGFLIGVPMTAEELKEYIHTYAIKFA